MPQPSPCPRCQAQRLAVVYYDAKVLFDWRITTSPGALEAFRAWGQDPYFNPGGLPVRPS